MSIEKKLDKGLRPINRYIACMVLHALGDTIGYKNSKWEFKPGSPEARTHGAGRTR